MNKYISYFGVSDLGKNRSNNEDAFIAQYVWDGSAFLAAAIDGVGGYEGGEIAAAIAKQSISDYLRNYPNGDPADLIKQAVVFANNTINSKRLEDGDYPNMSCVLTAALVDVANGYLYMAHVGDTRLYQYADGVLRKLSHDHSIIGYREEVGDLTEEEAMNHPQRNIIGRDAGSQSLDINTELVETATFPLEKDSIYLLCSDGLSDMLTSSSITDILSSDTSVEEKANALVDTANEAGGKDNITVVLIEYNGPTLHLREEIKDEIKEESVSENKDMEITQHEEIKTDKNESNWVYKSNLKRIEVLLAIIALLSFCICLLLAKIVLNQTNIQENNTLIDCVHCDSTINFKNNDTIQVQNN